MASKKKDDIFLGISILTVSPDKTPRISLIKKVLVALDITESCQIVFMKTPDGRVFIETQGE